MCMSGPTYLPIQSAKWVTTDPLPGRCAEPCASLSSCQARAFPSRVGPAVEVVIAQGSRCSIAAVALGWAGVRARSPAGRCLSAGIRPGGAPDTYITRTTAAHHARAHRSSLASHTRARLVYSSGHWRPHTRARLASRTCPSVVLPTPPSALARELSLSLCRSSGTRCGWVGPSLQAAAMAVASSPTRRRAPLERRGRLAIQSEANLS